MWLFYVIFRSDVSIPCSDGSYATGNATSCTQCLAGKICPNTDGTGIEDCLPGTYSTSGATVCTDCPAGYACPLTTTTQTDECPAGTYAIAKSTSCTPCPAGKYVQTSNFKRVTQGYHSPSSQYSDINMVFIEIYKS
jgi:hypothetical protein